MTTIMQSSISDNSDVHSEKSPLLTEQQKTYESEGGSGNEKAAEEGKTREKRKKTEKDFQTIRVPGTGTAPLFSFRKLWAFTGPGFLMSIAYLDPGNIESDLQAGAVAEYRLLWVLLWSTVMGLVLQVLSAKLGVVTGRHLAEVCHDQYSLIPRIFLWLCMELAIIGSDIQEVIGSALAIHIISQKTIPLWEGCLITGVDTFTFLFLESYGLRYLEGFFGLLIAIMCGMFGWMYIYAQPAQAAVVEGIFIPWCQNCSSGAVEQGLGIVGAVIMPHNLYLHSGLVLSRAISRNNKVDIKEGIKYNTIESTVALFISFIINLFVVCVFGASVFGFSYSGGDVQRECTQHISYSDIQRECTQHISLLNAADCLYYRYNCKEWVRYIWAIGLLAAGQSSTMTGTYAGQFVMEGFLNLHWARWKRVLLTRSVAMVPCVIIAIVAVNSLDYLDEYLNVEQSMLLPFSLIPLLHATSSKKVMGDFKNSMLLAEILANPILFLLFGILVVNCGWVTLCCPIMLKSEVCVCAAGAIVVWILAVVVVTINIYFIISTVAIPGKWWQHTLASIGVFIYLCIVLLYAFYPLLDLLWKKYKPQRFQPRPLQIQSEN